METRTEKSKVNDVTPAEVSIEFKTASEHQLETKTPVQCHRASVNLATDSTSLLN